MGALRARLGRQLEEIDRAGSLWRAYGLGRARLPKARFHDLRHTCATLLLCRNVNPRVVFEMFGPFSVAITLDTYSHVLPNMQVGAARALEEVLL